MGIKECVAQVETFNEIAGNLENVTHESLVAQANLVEEESKELLEAVMDGKPNEILKECIDCLVVIHGFVQLLEAQGYSVMAAWNSVNINNLSKFPASISDATDSVLMYEDEGIEVVAEENDHYQVYVLKDANSKVRKPINYKKVSIASFTPRGVLPKVKGL